MSKIITSSDINCHKSPKCDQVSKSTCGYCVHTKCWAFSHSKDKIGDEKTKLESIGDGPTENRKTKVHEYYGVILEPLDISIECQTESQSKDFKCIGWIIEHSYKSYVTEGGRSEWQQHWKRKIYDSRLQAFDSLLQSYQFENLKTTRYRSIKDMKYRIRPIYEMNNFEDHGCNIRDVVINKIIGRK